MLGGLPQATGRLEMVLLVGFLVKASSSALSRVISDSTATIVAYVGASDVCKMLSSLPGGKRERIKIVRSLRLFWRVVVCFSKWPCALRYWEASLPSFSGR